MTTRRPSELDLIGFEVFRDQLSSDIDERKVIRWSYANRFPPFIRFGHNKPRWDRAAVEQWFADRYAKSLYRLVVAHAPQHIDTPNDPV